MYVCTLIQMGPWTSVLIIKVSYLVRCPDFRGLNVRLNTNEIRVDEILKFCIQNFKSFVDFIQPSTTTKSSIRQTFDDAAKACIFCSQKIFLARNCSEWTA